MNGLILAEISMGLIVGSWLAYRLRDSIRSLVVRSMPVEKRISDDSYYIQTRASTIIAFLLALSMAGIFFWGVEKLRKAYFSEAKIVQQQTLLPIKAVPSTSVDTPDAPPPNEPSTTPEADETDQEAEPVPNSPPSSQQPSSYAINGHYYLQVGAFKVYESAMKRLEYFQQLLTIPVRLVTLPATLGPNKVLVGPFASRQQAMTYRQQQELLATAFVRKYP